jgi:hypothetical protein
MAMKNATPMKAKMRSSMHASGFAREQWDAAALGGYTVFAPPV